MNYRGIDMIYDIRWGMRTVLVGLLVIIMAPFAALQDWLFPE
jgi:hypothetical protein